LGHSVISETSLQRPGSFAEFETNISASASLRALRRRRLPASTRVDPLQ